MNKGQIEEIRNLNVELEGLKERRAALKKQIAEHRDNLTDNDIMKNKTEAIELKDSITKIENKIKEAQARAEKNKGETRNMDKILDQANLNTEEMETRASAFVSSSKMVVNHSETRSVLVSSGKVATPTGVSGINDAFNNVSSIVDQVKVEDCTGMGSNKVAYVKKHAAADATEEGADYNDSGIEFDFVTISPSTVTTISYLSKQVQKQSPLTYMNKVRECSLNALRAKAGNIIVSKILGSSLVVNKTDIAAIDEFALRKIALAYGGNENVVGNAVLYLNKEDLIAFGDVRGKNEKKATFEVIPNKENPNTGVIQDGGLSVAYCINSSLTKGTMIYGQPKNCELDLFSDYEIAVSDDFKFGQGLIAVRGDVELGADVVAADGFIKVVITPVAG